ncbi:hypothetical protein JOQ06_024223 [Pogonophryne albipinna]|uniref:Uncharacterized protein n=1 Tax=Pogonophryne albipinna TaxID=1090488 RepID=A0AAD6BPD4_9TELE|nr:hypothetical protein JOQ06_024223 [Pogonophryne albipinna]
MDNFFTNFGDLTAAHGLKSVLSRRWHFLKSQQKQAVHAYSGIAAMECHDLELQQDIEESDDNDYTSPESEQHRGTGEHFHKRQYREYIKRPSVKPKCNIDS